MDLLTAQRLSLKIGDSVVCEGLDLRIRAGESWALLGRNGVGKSTLLRHLGGLRSGHLGELLLSGDRLSELTPRARARRVAVLLQHSDPGFGASVLETVLTGRHPHLTTFAWEGADDLAIARRAIAALDLEDLIDRSLSTLSGGELRRVEIARLLTQACPLALLDEPLNHLDLAHQASCLRVLGERCVDADHALMMVVHDLNIAYQTCPNWLILNGHGEWYAGTRDALADPALLSRAYAHPISRLETPSGPMFRPDYPHPAAKDDGRSPVP